MSDNPFKLSLEGAVNRHSRETPSNTPDFVLAQFLDDCLEAFDRAVVRRAQWYGHMDQPAFNEAGRTDSLVDAIRQALDELGVPGDGYPAPVVNAVAILTKALGS